jgi:hypothetical protein
LPSEPRLENEATVPSGRIRTVKGTAMHCARAGFDQIGTVSLRGAPRETKQSRPDGRSTARKCSALLAMTIRGSRLDLIEACARRILYGVLSTSSVALILAGAAAAGAYSSHADLIATTVVLRGSTAPMHKIRWFPTAALCRQCCAAHPYRRRRRMSPLMPALWVWTTIRATVACCRATPMPRTTRTGPITGFGLITGLAESMAVGATGLPMTTAERGLFGLVGGPLAASLSDLPMPAGSAVDSR